MALLGIHYEGLDKPLVIDDVDYSCALGIRRTNQYGNAIDSWHGLVGATKVRLVVGKGESLAAPVFVGGASLTSSALRAQPDGSWAL